MGETQLGDIRAGGDKAFSILKRIVMGETTGSPTLSQKITPFSILKRIVMGETGQLTVAPMPIRALSVSSSGS